MKVYEFDVTAAVNKYSEKKLIPWKKLFLLGILAGAFIAIGAASSNAATHAIKNYGLAKTLAGVIFPVGLIMIVFIGGDLFTGDCLMFFGVLDKRFKFRKILPTLGIVYISNLVGALIIAVLVFSSGQFHYSDGMLGAYTIKIASAKVSMNFWQAFTSGILCNILVSVAVLMGAGAKDVVGKILIIFLPIFAFVIGGYEHCVANMYYISAGFLASLNEDYATKAMELYGITQQQLANFNIRDIVMNNLLPVTLGNIVGGMLFVAAPLYALSGQKHERTSIVTDKFGIINKSQKDQKVL